MLELMTSRHLREWETYFAGEHLGEGPHDRGDLGFAIVAQTIANANRGKGQRAFKVDDFLPQFSDPDEAGSDLYTAMGKIATTKPKRTRAKAKAPEAVQGEPVDDGPISSLPDRN